MKDKYFTVFNCQLLSNFKRSTDLGFDVSKLSKYFRKVNKISKEYCCETLYYLLLNWLKMKMSVWCIKEGFTKGFAITSKDYLCPTTL